MRTFGDSNVAECVVTMSRYSLQFLLLVFGSDSKPLSSVVYLIIRQICHAYFAENSNTGWEFCELFLSNPLLSLVISATPVFYKVNCMNID